MHEIIDPNDPITYRMDRSLGQAWLRIRKATPGAASTPGPVPLDLQDVSPTEEVEGWLPPIV